MQLDFEDKLKFTLFTFTFIFVSIIMMNFNRFLNAFSFKSILLFLIINSLIFSISHAQSSKKSRELYENSIKSVNELSKKGHYKSAENIIEKELLRSQKDNEVGYFIKFIEMKYTNSVKYKSLGDCDTILWNDMAMYSSKLSQQYKIFVDMFYVSVLKSKLNNREWEYRKVIYDDASIIGFNWTEKKINDTIHVLVNRCIQNASKIQLSSVHLPVLKGENYDINLNFQQLVAGYFIHLFENHKENKENDLLKNSQQMFSDVEIFKKVDFGKSSLDSNLVMALKLYQIYLTKSHIYTDLKRLKFVRQVLKNDTLYIQALERMLSKNIHVQTSNLIALELANWHFNSDKVKAMDIVKQAELKHPKSICQDELKNLKAKILLSSMALNIEHIVEPNQDILCKVQHTNVSELYVKVYKMDCMEYFAVLEGSSNQSKNTVINSLKNAISERTIQLKNYTDYKQHSTEFALDGLEEGSYLIVVMNKNSAKSDDLVINYQLISASNYTLEILNRDFITLNAKTGQVAELDFTVYKLLNSKFVKIKNGKTNSEGVINVNDILSIERYEDLLVVFNKGELFYKNYFYNSPIYLRSNISARIVTDRKIYRPGQTVYYKLIALDNQNYAVLKASEFEIELKNYSGNSLYKKKIISNDMGTYSDSILIPENGILNGSYMMLVTFKDLILNYDIQIESYKRPTFSAEFLESTIPYKIGDTVTIKGIAMAFANYPIANAQVKYKISYSKYEFYRFYRPTITALLNGEVKTNEFGEFEFKFPIQSNLFNKSTLQFQIQADIVDVNGEQHACSKTMLVSDMNRILNLNGAAENLANNEFKIEVKNTNLEFVDVPLNAIVKLYKIEGLNNDFKKKRPWYEAENCLLDSFSKATVFKSFFELEIKGKKVLLESKIFQNEIIKEIVFDKKYFAEQGQFLVELISIEGIDTIAKTLSFTNSELKEKPYQLGENLKLIVDNSKIHRVGDIVKVALCSNIPKGNAKVVIRNENKILTEQWISLDKQIKILQIPCTKNDIGNIKIFVAVTYDYRHFRDEISLKILPMELVQEVKTYRSNMESGSNEKWTIQLDKSQLKKWKFETVVGMYDASLDDLGLSNDWKIQLNENGYFGFSDKNLLGNLNSHRYQQGFYKSTNKSLDIRSFISFTAVGLNRYYYDNISYDWNYGDKVMRGNINVSEKRKDNFNLKNLEVDGDSVSDMSSTSEEADKSSASNIRSNFNETAFFYPHLVPNSDGQIHFSFKMPDALTKWKFMAFTHTDSLNSAYSELMVTTSKTLMVQANLPRFLRNNDVSNLPIKLVNTSDKSINANLKLIIKDAQTGKQLFWAISEDNISVEIPAKQSVNQSISIKVPIYSKAVLIQVLLNSEKYSDGEEHILPVLENRTFVTASMPITVKSKGIQNLSFSALLNSNSQTLVHHSFQVEMSSNPSWYAFRALPSLLNSDNRSLDQIFTRLFASSVSLKILESNPIVRETITKWRLKSGAFGSKLSQNEDLKFSTLDEMPWLKYSKTETEQMQELVNSMQIDKLKILIDEISNELLSLQNEDGSFSWYKGMPSNLFITQSIVMGFAKMKQFGIDITSYKPLLEKAIVFMDIKMQESYKIDLKNKQTNCSSLKIQYLFCKAFFKDLNSEKTYKTIEYYIDLGNKSRSNLSLLSQAQLAMAISLLRPSSDVPKSIIQALDEQSTTSHEMGMYWAKNKGGFYWNESHIATQANIIQAYQMISQDSLKIKEQKIWLLRQKQTQNWSSIRSTLEACFVLLMNNELSLNKQEVKIYVNDVHVKPGIVEAGTGYYKQSIEKTSIKASSGAIKVEAATDDFAYGAAYWQYFEDNDKIKSNASGLKIERVYFKIVLGKDGESLVELKAGDAVNVGDKLKVLLKISSDREIEYVQVSDARPSCTEPVSVLSVYKWGSSCWYYQVTNDVSTQFFIENLSKGYHQITYELTVQQKGEFDAGISKVQCVYAPEFVSNGSGFKLKVE